MPLPNSRFAAFALLALMVAASACGGSSGGAFGDQTDAAGSSSGSGSGSGNGGDAAGAGDAAHPGFGDDASFPDATSSGGGCTGLQCQAATCAAIGKPETTLTGTVRDPAGALPLYNIYAYIPNTKPDPILPGNPTCTACQAAASGSPILGALTDSNGKFTLAKGPNDTWGVPVGSNVPLVLQAGKWRRQVVIPQVTACTTIDLDAVLGADMLRLPKKSSEGDMPLMAVTTGGYDAFECFLRVIGVDDSEFVPPGSPTGHVQVYTGAFDTPTTPAANIAGGNSVADTFQWWTSAANLGKYDIVLNGCDGINGTRPTAAYTAMASYLDGGGRAFVTDSFEDWFAPPTGDATFQSVASWQTWLSGNSYANYFADTSVPQGPGVRTVAAGELRRDAGRRRSPARPHRHVRRRERLRSRSVSGVDAVDLQRAERRRRRVEHVVSVVQQPRGNRGRQAMRARGVQRRARLFAQFGLDGERRHVPE